LSNLKNLVERYKKGEETLGTIFIRSALLINRLRYRPPKILEEQWDYLIILDACRYDIFKKVNKIPGCLSKRISAGTHTVEWSKNVFSGNLDDIVYVSANPQVSNIKLKKTIGSANAFFHLENVWDWGWDDQLSTVHPLQVNEAVSKLRIRYPGKRMIIHYIQPHSPYIGEPNLQHREVNEKIPLFRWWQNQIKSGELTTEQFKKAYTGNLELVLKYVDELIRELEGRIIITSDHGEAFGELGIYAHPPMMNMKVLLEVPWLIVEKTNKN